MPPWTASIQKQRLPSLRSLSSLWHPPIPPEQEQSRLQDAKGVIYPPSLTYFSNLPFPPEQEQAQLQDAKGVIHTSPGQRPGYIVQTLISAESATHSPS